MPKNAKKTIDSKKTAPANTSRKITTQRPVMKRTPHGTRVTHMEFIGEVIGHTLFEDSVVAYDLNPGRLAPWIKTQATGWEQYRYSKLKFHFISRRGTASSGSILAVVDYNVYDETPASEAQMSSYSGCVEDSLWQDLTLNVDMKAYHAGAQRKFVRTSSAPSGDLKSYDGGRLFTATVGASDPLSATHKLWVEYEVEFFVPETEAEQRAAGFAELRSTAGTPWVAATETKITCDKIYDGIGLIAEAKGFKLPKGFYSVVCNNSSDVEAVGADATTNVPISSLLQVLLNGVPVNQSASGGSLKDKNFFDYSQLENTVLACFRAKEGDLLEVQNYTRTTHEPAQVVSGATIAGVLLNKLAS